MRYRLEIAAAGLHVMTRDEWLLLLSFVWFVCLVVAAIGAFLWL
jgi:hypothetical protein